MSLVFSRVGRVRSRTQHAVIAGQQSNRAGWMQKWITKTLLFIIEQHLLWSGKYLRLDGEVPTFAFRHTGHPPRRDGGY